jgi:hypothetical protein
MSHVSSYMWNPDLKKRTWVLTGDCLWWEQSGEEAWWGAECDKKYFTHVQKQNDEIH